jgi:2-methylcitrate dehydratase
MSYATEDLAHFALGMRFDELPASVITATKRIVLDTLGCAIGAIGCEPARVALRAQTPSTSTKPVTIIGSRQRGALEQALLINGILARYLDYGDVYWKRDVCHPSELVPVALSCVEERGGSGKTFIEALLVGYEAQLRLCDAYSFQAVGMHNVSSVGFVSPLIIGRAWNMDAREIANAVALNGVRHLTLFGMAKGELSMAKAIAAPLACVEAVGACRLAAEGYTGPVAILDWMFEHLPDGVEDPQDKSVDVALSRYRIERVSLKRYPVQFEIQGAVEAALSVFAQLPGPAIEAVSEITVTMNPVSQERTADPKKYRPSTRESADHSTPCCVAMTLQDGNVAPEQFETRRWADTDVVDLMSRIRVVGDPNLDKTHPGGRPCIVTAKLANGATLTETVDIPIGDAQRPMSEEDVREKFRALAADLLSPSRAEEIIAIVDALERLDRIADLTALLVNEH